SVLMEKEGRCGRRIRNQVSGGPAQGETKQHVVVDAQHVSAQTGVDDAGIRGTATADYAIVIVGHVENPFSPRSLPAVFARNIGFRHRPIKAEETSRFPASFMGLSIGAPGVRQARSTRRQVRTTV